MDGELEQYLTNVGLSANMLKPASSTQPSGTASNGDSDKGDDEDYRHDDVIVADSERVSSTTALGSDVNQHDLSVSHAVPTVAASLTVDSCCTAADGPSTQTDCDTASKEQHAALLSHNSSNSAEQTPCSVNGSVQGFQQHTVTVSGNTAQVDCSERVTSQSSSSRSAVVYSTVPRQVDRASTLPSPHPQKSQVPPVSSSCTCLLYTSDAADE